MPAVLNASGPIKVPRCDALISMGTPSKATREFLTSGSDMRLTFKDRVGKAKTCPPSKITMQDGGHGARAPLPILPYALKYAIWVVVASSRPLGDQSSPF